MTTKNETPRRPLMTRAEIYQLAVWWLRQPETFMRSERLFWIGRVLGRRALGDAGRDAADGTTFEDAPGYLLESPWIERPDEVCEDFEPTAEECRVLDQLYLEVGIRCRQALVAHARWSQAA